MPNLATAKSQAYILEKRPGYLGPKQACKYSSAPKHLPLPQARTTNDTQPRNSHTCKTSKLHNNSMASSRERPRHRSLTIQNLDCAAKCDRHRAGMRTAVANAEQFESNCESLCQTASPKALKINRTSRIHRPRRPKLLPIRPACSQQNTQHKPEGSATR